MYDGEKMEFFGYPISRILWAFFTNAGIALMIITIAYRRKLKLSEFLMTVAVAIGIDIDHAIYYFKPEILERLYDISLMIFRHPARWIHTPMFIGTAILFLAFPRERVVQILFCATAVHISVDLILQPLVSMLTGITIG